MKKILLLLALVTLPAYAVNLRWAAQNDIVTLDPHSQNHATTNAVIQHTYEGLTRYNKEYKAEPSLATSWKQMSDTQWRFNLRKDVKFHDGSPFTADDVVFSFGRIQQPQGTMQIYVTGVKEMREDRRPHGGLHPLRPGADPAARHRRLPHHEQVLVGEEPLAERAGLRQEGRDLRLAQHQRHRPVHHQGLGAGQAIVFAQNKDWWGKLEGNVTDVVYTPIKSDATRVSALLAGDVDLVTDLPVQDVERLRKESKVKVLDGHEVRTIFIGMDQHNSELKYSNVKGKNPFQDLRVRRAMNLAVDREAIKRVAMRGLSIPAGIMVAPGVHGHSKDIDVVLKPDPAAAKKLLAEAGYPDGFEFALDCPNNRYVNDEKICQALVGMWSKAGFKPRLNSMPFATFIAKIQNFDSSAYMLGWGVATFDAQYSLQSLVRTKTGGAEGNFNLGRISDPKLDTTIDAIKIATDP